MKTPPRSLRSAAWVISAAFCGWMILRLFLLIDRFSVNLLFYDNFDYYFTLAGKWNYWQRFTAQLGPHREGLGILISSAIAPLSRWDMRAEAFAIGIILIIALAACLWMKHRAFGRLSWIDLIVLPALFLTPRQWELWSITINSSHGAVPLMLIMLWCLSWTIPDRRWRDAGVLTANFFAIFTGFGFFLGLVTPAVYALIRGKTGLRVSLASLLVFFIGYKFNPANPAFRLLDPALLRLSYAIAVGLSHALNVTAAPWDQIVGFCLLAILLWAAGKQLPGIARADTRSIISVSLIAFSLFFAVAASVGRISIGDKFLTWSRYVPLLVPGFVGVYLSIDRLKIAHTRVACLAVSLALALQMSARVMPADQAMMEKMRSIKLGWIAKYRQTGDLAAANHAGDLGIYPEPLPPDFAGKIDYLRQHRLNFFKGK